MEEFEEDEVFSLLAGRPTMTYAQAQAYAQAQQAQHQAMQNVQAQAQAQGVPVQQILDQAEEDLQNGGGFAAFQAQQVQQGNFAAE